MREMVLQFEQDLKKSGLHYDRKLILRFIASCMTKRFVILTGLSGSGKTKLAQAFAKWITQPSVMIDPFKPGSEITSDRITYFVEASDSISIEFWNNPEATDATKVVLPRGLIEEWTVCLIQNRYTRSTPARQIRETVAKTTRYSRQLNSFETHLKAAAFALTESCQHAEYLPSYEVVSVGANWISNDNILGYADALDASKYIRTRALDLILRAIDSSELPHFLILDEMNLSHVERYFADILSSLESGEDIQLHSDKDSEGHPISRDGVQPNITLPRNLFIIGTVNVDETTYMFSPKVLDRANVIEFRVNQTEMDNFLDSPKPVSTDNLENLGKDFGKAFVREIKKEHLLHDVQQVEHDIIENLKTSLLKIFQELSIVGAEFGYRTAMEISRFFSCYYKLAGDDWKFEDALDAQVVQKILPKLHGSNVRLKPVLEVLLTFCEESGCHVSADKIRRMEKQLIHHGFTSFAEA